MNVMTQRGRKKKEKKDGEDSDSEDAISKGLDSAMKLEYEYFKHQMKAWNKDPLTLSHILNIIDGLLECHGRILIITTNQPEKLDSALIRPGRVDMKVHFDWCTTDDCIKIVEMFFEQPVPQKYKAQIADKQFTAAEIYQICFQSVDMEKALPQLVKKEEQAIVTNESSTVVKSEISLKESMKLNRSTKKQRAELDGPGNITVQFIH